MIKMIVNKIGLNAMTAHFVYHTLCVACCLSWFQASTSDVEEFDPLADLY